MLTILHANYLWTACRVSSSRQISIISLPLEILKFAYNISSSSSSNAVQEPIVLQISPLPWVVYISTSMKPIPAVFPRVTWLWNVLLYRICSWKRCPRIPSHNASWVAHRYWLTEEVARRKQWEHVRDGRVRQWLIRPSLTPMFSKRGVNIGYAMGV